ncbi:hypothetical protein BS17DRAFT_692358 [Gyrodon lividus]|nr:hypothetical protein BS17DRAFT_692358 [Gyrodon lividus]
MPEPEPTSHVSRQSLGEQRTRQSFSSETRSRTVSEFGAGRSFTPPVIAEHHSMKQKDQWLEAARKSTEHFNKHGSPIPLVWVLVEDNNIPPNAVPFGEDRNGAPLYIARALLEVYLGRAGSQLSGAVIGYAGKERIMAKYEVLVCASQLRWGFPTVEHNGVLAQGTVILAQQHKEDHHQRHDIPRYIPDGFAIEPEREAELKRLAEIKTVILIDDSISMTEGDLWQQAGEALAGIVDIANKYGSVGADIHFMHQDEYGPNMKSKEAVNALFNRVQPEGTYWDDTPTGAKLGQILEHYLPFLEREGSTHEPITVIVITDGVATDQGELERSIVEAAHRLDRNGVREDAFGIQFVQIGTDQAAADVLHALDDHLVDHYKIRDMVDSTPFNPEQGAFNTEYMLKILLGGLRKDLDNAPPNAIPSTLLTPLGGSTLTIPLAPARPASVLHDRSPRVASARLGGVNALGTPPRAGYH